jgi:DNA-directed RNA polymerase subunit beta'
MAVSKKQVVQDVHPDDLEAGGTAIEKMLSQVDVAAQMKDLKSQILETKSPSKRNTLVKRLKYIAALNKMDMAPEDAYMMRVMPVAPPLIRPPINMGGNRIEYADVNQLYRDHMLVNGALKDIKDIYPNEQLVNERKALYEGAKAVVGLGDAITGSSRGKQLQGFVKQISGNIGPKGGFFQSKLLSRKQDFSGRATIYADPTLEFNQAAIPEEMLWNLLKFHIIRDLVKNGYDYVTATKAWDTRNDAAKASFSRTVKNVPILGTRAPTLMRTNIGAWYAKPVQGKTIGINPLHLKYLAADFDGDATSWYAPMLPESIEEAKKVLTPSAHIYDYRKGHGIPLAEIGHEAIIGSTHMTEPDKTQEIKTFKTEAEVLDALKKGLISENTPIRLED